MFSMIIGLILVGIACESQAVGNRKTLRQNSASLNSQHVAQRKNQMQDEMIRRVNSIVDDIELADERLIETEHSIQDEKKILDQIKQDAKTSYVGGQMNDFRTWQRLGQEVNANIEEKVRKASNTMAAVRRNSKYQLQRVNWISNNDNEIQTNRVNLLLQKLETWETNFSQLTVELSAKHSWLDVKE